MRIAILICLLLAAGSIKAQYNNLPLYSPDAVSVSLAGYSPGHHWHNDMRGLGAADCVNYCLIMGGGSIFFDGIFNSGSSNPDDRKSADGAMAFGAGCVATGIFLVYLESRSPRYACNMAHKPDSFCYTKQGYPRFCVATSNNGVGMGVNFK